jgi:hypothetical protein
VGTGLANSLEGPRRVFVVEDRLRNHLQVRVWGLGFRVRGLGLGFWVLGLGFGFWGFGFGVGVWSLGSGGWCVG